MGGVGVVADENLPSLAGRYEQALRSRDRASELKSLQSEVWSLLISDPSKLDELDDRTFESLVVYPVRVKARDAALAEQLRGELAASLGGDRLMGLTPLSLSRVVGVGSRLGVTDAQRASWVRSSIDLNPTWRESPLMDLSLLLQLASQSGKDVDLSAARQAVMEQAIGRLERTPAEQWLADDGAFRVLGQIRHSGLASAAQGQKLEDRRAAHEAANALRQLYRTRLAAEVVDDASIFRELVPDRFDRLLAIGQLLDVPRNELSGWRVRWVVSSTTWHGLGAESLAKLHRELRQLPPEAEAGSALAGVREQAIADAGRTPGQLLAALDADLLSELSRGDESGWPAIAKLLRSSLASPAPELTAALTLTHMERIRLLASRVGVPDREVGSWIGSWVSASPTWRTSSSSASPVLWLLDLYAREADLSSARAVVLDHVLSSADQPGWLSNAYRSWGVFVGRVWQALAADARFQGQQDRDAALAKVLNAPGLMGLWGLEGGRGQLVEGREALQRWYAGMQLPGGPDADALATAIHDGLLSGVLEPRPTTLALLAWYDRTHGEYEAWTDYLDDRIGATLPGSEGRVQWLLGRAYAQEIGGGRPTVLRGESWLRQAYAETSGELKVGVGQILVMQLAAAERFDEAELFVKELQEVAGDEKLQRQVASMARQLPIMRVSAEREAEQRHRHVEQAQAQARSERARRKEAVSGQ